jgi:hypothetical protein
MWEGYTVVFIDLNCEELSSKETLRPDSAQYTFVEKY